jgi:NAD+ kinase
VKTIALVAKRGKPEAVALAQKLKERHPALTFLAERSFAEQLGWDPGVADAELAQQADLVIVLGGDGTLIHAARLLHGREVPVLGVNLGSLGFMTEIPVQELFPTLEQVLEGHFQTDARLKLSCRLHRDGKLIVEDDVVNDVVISKGALARIADHEVTINGNYVCVYKADGLIVASPTGSTAYALSAGGPILHPSLQGMVIAPICPHALTQRPLVIPSEQTIQVALKSEVADTYLTLDGQAGHTLQTGDRLEISRSRRRLMLIKNPKMDYFGVLRQKLHWGER